MEKKVLVIDDEEAIRLILTETLADNGYEVRTAGTPEEALKIIAEEKILIHFVDMMLPGMNGLELCRHIKRQYPTAYTFAMTGHSSVFDLIRCREAGCEDYFAKPFQLVHIIEAADFAYSRLKRWRKS
jgi:DNA-binding response OmpR family regulator